ncbi:MAG: tetratricopeptide repeat protein [Pseudomonadota bacterium]
MSATFIINQGTGGGRNDGRSDGSDGSDGIESRSAPRMVGAALLLAVVAAGCAHDPTITDTTVRSDQTRGSSKDSLGDAGKADAESKQNPTSARRLGGTNDEPASDRSVVVASAPTEPLVIERPIPETSVFPLLVAEFAIRRRDFGRALQIYLSQAEILRDAGVSAHATHLAQFLRREGDAYRAVNLWVELDPASVEAHGTMASLLARQGRTIEALPHFAFVAKSGEAAKFPLLLNQYKNLSKDDQRTLDVQVQALLDDGLGDTVSLLLTHALMADESGDSQLALKRLKPVFEQEPYQEQALVLEAKIRSAAGDDDALKRIEKALEIDNTRSQLRLQYARLLAPQDMAAAREQFEILSAQAPNNADLLFSLAVINRELRDGVAAKAYLRKVLALGRRQDEAYFLLAQISRDEGKPDEAIRLFQQVGDGKDLIRATVSIAQIQLAAGRDADFARYMDRLRSSYPRRREQLFSVEANLYSEARRTDASLALLNRALDEFPTSDSLRYSRSVILERQGDIDGAVSDLREIIARTPDNATALNALGYTLANRTQRYTEARELIEKALKISPDEPAILDSMGWVLFHQGEYVEALTYLTRAYENFPDPEVAAHLGEVMWVTGDRGSAMELWREALARNPEHAVLTNTLDRLGITLQAGTQAGTSEARSEPVDSLVEPDATAED